MRGETVWQFKTKRFRVELQIFPEDLDPADSFEFQDDIDAVRTGQVEWFRARTVVYFVAAIGPDIEIGSDSLGACAYTTVAEFYEGHRNPDYRQRNCSLMRRERGAVTICYYFPDMVAQAVSEARSNIARLCKAA